ncbi:MULTISPECIES: AbrB family transcriptional regulator [unclassified Sphingomonas]|uniref:AbrB family transcriptional regulator n=1 Tax=unclassified Sphingomonas TaxID=196159 RepID=UPI0006F63AB7|nr:MULTISPECIES: AbrB family transcriptional regulator [unclassified Sphingomonas]KQM96827.1 monooxygenase [Sphingomonas sp. Leaf25]
MNRDAASTTLRFLAALAVGGAGGAAFDAAGAPLPWVLGSMAACAVASVAGAPIRASSATRRPMAAVIGVVLGSSFHPGLWAQAREWIVPLLCLPFFLGSAAILCVTYFRRVAKFDPATAYFAGMPGGIAEMVLMGETHGADERAIGLIHGARIFLVVFTLPWALHLIRPGEAAVAATIGGGAFTWSLLPWALGCMGVGLVVGRALRLPAWHLIGPLAVSAAVHVTGISDFRIPGPVVAAAQVGLGATIGCRFIGLTLPVLLRTLALAAGSTAILLGLTALWACAIAYLTGFDPVLLTLGYSPGGLAEMSMVALGLSLEPGFVIVHHLTRVVLVLVAAPLAFRPAR